RGLEFGHGAVADRRGAVPGGAGGRLGRGLDGHHATGLFQREILRKSAVITSTIPKLTTDMAADSPMSELLRMNMKMVEVAVEYPGWPCVMAQMIGKLLKTFIMLISTATVSAGRSSGGVIDQ